MFCFVLGTVIFVVTYNNTFSYRVNVQQRMHKTQICIVDVTLDINLVCLPCTGVLYEGVSFPCCC